MRNLVIRGSKTCLAKIYGVRSRNVVRKMNQDVMQESPIVKAQHVAGEGMVLIGGRPDM